MDHHYTDPLIDPEIFISNVSKTAKESFCFDLLLASVPIKVSYIYRYEIYYKDKYKSIF